MKFQYLVLILIAVLLISGCTQKTDIKPIDTTSPPKYTPADTSTPPKFSPEQSTLPAGLEGKFVGTWWVGKSEFKADQGGIYYPEDPAGKIALNADKTWEDDKGKKGTWSVEAIEDGDWEKWGVSWDSSAGKPEKKFVLKGTETVSGWIEQGDTTNMFWLFFRFEGNQEIPAGWIQLRFEKLSDTPKVEPTQSSSTTPVFNPSRDPEVAKTKVVSGLESKLVGEWGFGKSRHLALRATVKWELVPEAGGSSGTWELKDVTAADIKKWKEDDKISDASEIASKKLVFYDRKCGQTPETEEVFLSADDQSSFGSCGIAWRKL